MNKFRVYDKERGEYSGEYFVSSKCGELFMVRDFWLPSMKLTLCDSDRYIVEWFTGFHDSKGREIYEGDIIETPAGIGPVISTNSGAWAWQRSDGKDFPLIYISGGLTSSCKIIGTIRDREDA